MNTKKFDTHKNLILICIIGMDFKLSMTFIKKFNLLLT